VAFICGVSTLAFNGNPLLRFDGYYVLCDAPDLPNLARSRAWWRYVIFNRRLGLAEFASPEPGGRALLALPLRTGLGHLPAGPVDRDRGLDRQLVDAPRADGRRRPRLRLAGVAGVPLLAPSARYGIADRRASAPWRGRWP
jgi:hypothetical protein